MKFSLADTRDYSKDSSWALGVWFHRLDEFSLDIGLGYYALGLEWRRARPSRRVFGDTSWGLGLNRDPERIWSLWFGPWMVDFA